MVLKDKFNEVQYGQRCKANTCMYKQWKTCYQTFAWLYDLKTDLGGDYNFQMPASLGQNISVCMCKKEEMCPEKQKARGEEGEERDSV